MISIFYQQVILKPTVYFLGLLSIIIMVSNHNLGTGPGDL